MMAQQEARVIVIEASQKAKHELEKTFGPRLWWWELGYLHRGRGVCTPLTTGTRSALRY